MQIHRTLALLLVLSLLAAPPAAAQIVKKYLTPDNKVIYSDKPVPGAREVGEIAPPKPVDPEQREAAEKRAQRDAEESKAVDERLAKRRAQESRIAAAEAALERARERLLIGKTVRTGERTGTAGGGSSLNEAYWARQKANESAVKAAENELEAARAGR